MDEDRKKQIAVFRFGVIHEFVGGAVLDYGEQERLLGERCARKWQIPFSNRTRVSRGAMLSWIKQYKDSGGKLESLHPKDRQDRKKSRAIDEHTAKNLIALKKSMPRATVPALIKLMEKRRLVSPGTSLKTTTVYRLLNSHKLMKPAVG